MGKRHAPRRGSMQFWPRCRATKEVPRIRAWAQTNDVKPLAFLGYKVGMAHVMALDSGQKSPTKGQVIHVPVTVVECPPVQIIGVQFYNRTETGWKKISSVLAPQLDATLSRRLTISKKSPEFPSSITCDDVRLLVASLVSKTTTGAKAPKIMEVAIGGKKDQKLAFAKQMLGKEMSVQDVLKSGMFVDVHGVSKGKGYQGAVKRFGIDIRQHKSEKTKRGSGSLGAWCAQMHMMYRVPMAGKTGYHCRVEYNKQVLSLGSSLERKGGFHKYGALHNPHILIKGSLIGPAKRVVALTFPIRQKHQPESLEVRSVVV